MILQVMFNALVQTAIYMIMALGLTLIFGVMKISNLTHGAIFALGAFIHYTLYECLEIPFVTAIICRMGGSTILINVMTNIWGTWPLRIHSPFARIRHHQPAQRGHRHCLHMPGGLAPCAA